MSYAFRKVVHGDTEPIICENSICRVPISEGTPYMLGSDGKTFCVPCGQCTRFEMRREDERQERRGGNP